MSEDTTMAIAAKIVEKVEALPLSEIDFDARWNARSNIETGSGEVDTEKSSNVEKNGFKGLKESIKMRGQDEAIIVRPHPDSKSKKPYMAVTGHRRGAAIAQIAAENKNPKPTINAIVRKLTEEQARELNLSENTARDDLSGPDLAFGVKKMKENNASLTGMAIAAKLGMNTAYINRLLAITERLRPELLQDWRENGIVSTGKLEKIAKGKEEEQKAKYEEAKRGIGGKAVGRNAWIENTKVALMRYAGKLGQLEREGQLTIEDVDAFFDVTDADAEGGIAQFVSIKKEATDSQRAKFSAAAQEAFEKAVNAEEGAKAAPEAPKSEPKGKAKPKGKANGHARAN